MQQTPLQLVLQPESATAQTPDRQSGDAIVRWNALTLDIIKTEKTSPPIAVSNLAIVHTTIYNATSAVSKTHKVYKVQVEAPAGASAEAAAAAAHRVLTNLYPKQTATLDAAKTASLVVIAEWKLKTDGLELGEFVANKILEWRKDRRRDCRSEIYSRESTRLLVAHTARLETDFHVALEKCQTFCNDKRFALSDSKYAEFD